MQFKRFTAALCAASIALTQTAIVPISVSADNTAAYADATTPQSFTDQYSFTLGVGNTSVSAGASAKSVTLDGSAVTDTSSELSFFYGGSINSDFAFQDGNVFNFSVEGLTVTASKDRTTAVAEQTITLGTYGQTYSSSENIVFDKDQCSNAIENSQIIVSFSEIPSESDTPIPASIDIQDANGNTICTGVTNTSGNETYFDLTADTAASIRENGFILVVNDLMLNSVSLSVPAHDEQEHEETSAEIGSNSWSITAENGVLSTADQIVNLTDSIFTDLADFSANGSVTATWTSFTCSLERNETEEDGVAINEKNFPDEKFRNYVSDNFDTNKSGVLSDSEIAAAKTIDIRSSGITNLTGIEYFTEAESLYLDYTNPSVCDISQNIKLKELTLTYSKINYIDITKNTQLETIDAHMCDLSRLDTSKCTKLKSLNVGGSKIIALDLSNCSELTEFYPGEPYILISVQNDRFDLSTLAEYGLDVSKILSVSNAELNGSVLTFSADTSSASYTYDTGIDGKPLNVTLNIDKRTYSGFIISYEADGTENTVPCETWNDVLKTINNNSIDYTITLQSDVDVSSLKFPSAAKSITLISDGDAKTITTSSSSVTIPTDVTLKNISIESTANTFTLTANKNLTIDGFTSKTLTNLNGGANSTLSILNEYTADFNINKFGTLRICHDTVFNKTVNVGSFKFENEPFINIGSNSVTVNNIVGRATICYINDYTPITIKGNINNGFISFLLYDENSIFIPFTSGATIAVSNTADLSALMVETDSLPGNSTLARVGSDIKIMSDAFKLSCNGTKVGTYALWSDVIAAINNPTAKYIVEILTDVDFDGAFTMPKAGTFQSLNISCPSERRTLSFTGNVVLTGKTSFYNIKLESYKKVENVHQPANFTMTANYDIYINALYSDTLTAINGSEKAQLYIDGSTNSIYAVDFEINKFGTVDLDHSIEFRKAVNVGKLCNWQATVYTGVNSVTVKDIEDFFIIYTTDDFTPITVTGNVVSNSNIIFSLVDSNDYTTYKRFDLNTVVLKSKTADLGKLSVATSSSPNTPFVTFARDGSDVRIMAETLKLLCNGKDVGTYALWSDVIAAINDPTAYYTVEVLADTDIGGALTMPKAGTFESFDINGGDINDIKTLSFTGNVVLNGITGFSYVKLESYKIVENVRQPANFTITANDDLDIFGNFDSETLSEIKGSTKSDLTMFLYGSVDYDITGFNTVTIPSSSNIEYNGNINTSNLELYNSIKLGQGSVTAANITYITYSSSANIKYSYANFTPITVTGSITGEDGSKLTIALYYSNNGTDATYQKFSAGDTVLIADTADISQLEIYPDCMPDGENGYTLAKVGSDVKIIENVFKLTCNGNDVGTYAQWSDVIAAINDPTAAYTVKVLDNTDIGGAFTMPKAGTFKSLEIIGSSYSNVKTLSFTGNVVLTGETSFSYIKLESYKKVGNSHQPANFTITTNYDLAIYVQFYSDTLTAINGSAQSTLKLENSLVYCDIIDFNTIDVDWYANLRGTVKATNLDLNSKDITDTINVSQNSVTFENIIYGDGASIQYTGENFTPITVTGSIINEADSKLSIYLVEPKMNKAIKFSAGDTVLTSKTADLSLLEIFSKCLPDTENSYTLARVGSDVKVMKEAFKLTCNGNDVGTYAQWNDVIAAINDPTAAYTIEVLADTDIGGTFTMPKAGTFKSLSITSSAFPTRTLSFTGNVVLTGETRFNDIRLESYKNAGNSHQPANFTVTANYDLTIEGDFYSDTLTAINGSAQSTLKLEHAGIYCDIIGFNTIDVDSYAWLRGTVKATNLDLSSNDRTYSYIYIGQNSVTVANIIYGDDAFIRYTDKNFTPITVTESIINKTDSKLSIVLSNGSQKFSAGDTVLISKTADLSLLEIVSECLPDNENSYSLARVGSDVKVMKEAFMVEYNGQTEVFAQWSDVLDLIDANAKAGNKDYSYDVTLVSDYDMNGAFKMPAANTYKSLSFKTKNDATTIKFTGNIVLTGKTKFSFIKLESYKKVGNAYQPAKFTITANYDLEIDGTFASETLTAINGSAKSTLKLFRADIYCDIIGFNTIDVDIYANLKGTVKATNLDLSGNDSTDTVNIGQNSVTFANIIHGNGSSICYTDKNFTPITVTGSITTETDSKLSIELYNDSTPKFNANDTVLKAKTADLSQLEINSNCLPDDGNSYTLGRVGSDVKVMTEAFVVEYNEQTAVYAQWSDVLDLIAANAKAGNKNYRYDVTLVSDYDMNGAFKMPSANTYNWLSIENDNEAKTIRFTGNITLTGTTTFCNVNLVSQKKINNVMQSVEFSIYAGKNILELFNTDSKIKSIASNSLVKINNVTVGTITADYVNIIPESRAGHLTTFASLDSFAANADEWNGKDAPETEVNITGNFTARKLLAMDNGKLYVGGIFNVGSISSIRDNTIVVNKQAKGKYPLVIGKDGISNIPSISNKSIINFVLLDPETGKTAKITDETILGTITGPYADQLIPSNDNLEADDSYYIIKSGNKLIAKPKDTAGLVEAVINDKTTYYKNLDEAIKDINATGKATDNITIYLTQDMFKTPIAKLPLPNAGKYGSLTYTANSNVTVSVTGDLTLTGSLRLNENVALNKVDKNGNVLPISVNVGKYALSAKGTLSAKDISARNAVSQFANISGTGEFITYKDAEISGKVTGITLGIFNSTVTLGEKAVFNASVYTPLRSTLAYTNAKNVTLVSIAGEGLRIEGKFAENDTVANITGDYTKDAAVINGGLKVVRSGNTLKAVTAENVVEVTDKAYKTRTYDSLASVMTDISRINDKEAEYTITVKNNDTFVLPKANTYKKLKIYTNETKVVLTTAKDLTLTGNLVIGENVFINKTNDSAMSVNLGNYDLTLEGNAGIAYDSQNGVSRFTNISGKGGFYSSNSCTVSGKLNVGFYSVLETTLGEKASFSAAKINALNNVDKLIYPISIAKNVKLGDIEGSSLTLVIDGVKSGDQVAVLTGDYVQRQLNLDGYDGFMLVRSGNKLIVTERQNAVLLRTLDDDRVYYSYADAITDINRLNDKDGEYTILLQKDTGITRLTLPAKGKYNTLALTSNDTITLKLTSDVALTGNLVINGDIILQKNEGTAKDILKFTSPKDSKTKEPIYFVGTEDGGVIVNGTLNGEKIDSSEKPVVENGTLPYTNKDGFDLSNNSVLKIAAKADVKKGGSIVITLKAPITSKIVLRDSENTAITSAAPASGSNIVTFTLDDELVDVITETGFKITGDAGIITNVDYIAPEG